ncbi:MAG: TonB-dependent receptor, partial [Pyrinomonadaceae bacterium]
MIAPTSAQQGTRLEGFVLDQDGRPVVGAEVILWRRGSALERGATDAEGRFTLVAAPPGLAGASVAVEASGFGRTALNLDDTRAGELLRFVLVPSRVAEELTVTATRAEARLDETAASVAVVSAAVLHGTAALTLDDALRQVPGFQLFRRAGSRTANPTAQGVSLRGVGASGASRALVLFDGVPLNDPFGGWVQWGRVPRLAVGRVEVLRGGASGLYGSAALGGIVNVEPRPVSSSPTLSLEISYGNQQTPNVSLYASGRAGKWGASLAAEATHTDGYVLVAERERGPVDTPAGARDASLLLTLERRFAPESRAFLRGAWFAESRRNGTPLQTNRTRLRQLSAGGEWSRARFGSFSARAYAGTQSYEQVFTAVSAERNSETLTRRQRVPAQSAGLSAQWSRPAGGRHTLVAGLDVRAVRGASDEVAFAAGRPASLVDAGGRELSAGFFVEDIFAVTSRLTVTTVARFDRWRNYDARQTTRPLSQAGAASVNTFPARSESAFSPQASALFRVSERIALHASGYRAFRAPTLNELYRSFRVGDVLTLANEDLRAERLTGGEAGAGLNFFDRAVRVRGTFFWSEITRPIANVTLR